MTYIRPAAPGFENVPCVALQAHIDMVCSAHSDVVFDFITQPIDCIVDGNVSLIDFVLILVVESDWYDAWC